MSTIITFLSIALVLYVVYQLGSLAGIFSERAGVANVAIEGNMIIGAVVFGLIYNNLTYTGGPELTETMGFIIAIIISVPLSATFMFLMSTLTNRYLSDHIIAGTGLNLIAPAIMLLIYNSLFIGASTDLVINNISLDISNFVMNIDGNRDMNYLILFFVAITILIVLVSSFVLNQTKFGLRLRSSGENPYALETAGISVNKTRTIALYISGLLSSLAGAAFMLKGNFYFTVEGSGFLSIGIMILGQYRVYGTFIGSIILSSFIALINTVLRMNAGLDSMIGDMYYLVKALPFIIPIIGLMVFRKSYIPKAVGKNFKKDQR